MRSDQYQPSLPAFQSKSLPDLSDAELRAWDALVTAERLNPTLRPAWMGLVLDSHARSRSNVAVAMANSTMGFLPLISSRVRVGGVPVTALDAASNLVSYHAELVVPGGNGAHAVDLLKSALDAQKWDIFRFSNVVEGSPTAQAIRALATSEKWAVTEGEAERSPYLLLQQPWADYARDQTKRSRANLTRYAKRIEQNPEFEMRWFEAGSDTDELLRLIIAVEDRSWKKKEGIAISDRAHELRYHELLLPYLSQSGALLANVLCKNSAPVAYVLCAQQQGWVGQLKTSFDPDIGDAGSCVVAASVRRAFECGYDEYDFLGEADKHKLLWTEKVRSHVNFTLFSRTMTGRFLAATRGVRRSLGSLRAARH